ncbi:MAG: nuclease-related domain-containing protein [Desulfurivibrionaceae bacterium]|jgi:hypothetical protein
MSDLLIFFVPVLIMFLFFAFAIGLLAITRKLHRRGRRNPLTSDLLRNPGESLREKLDDLNLDQIFYLLCLVFGPLIIWLQFLPQSHLDSSTNSSIAASVHWLAIVGLTFFMAVQIVRTMRKRQSLRLGLECELAVGQELNQLMLVGCRVYHDFPAENFNIDHIIIGPAGVYAVETKGRAKPDKGRGTEDVRVVYDGKALRFPGWTETEPIAQAKRQAQWLANWLKSAVGHSISVQPALALPGWFIDRQGRDMVVFNSKNPGFLARPRGERVLSDELIQRVAHQVEQRCRTVELLSYRTQKGK